MDDKEHVGSTDSERKDDGVPPSHRKTIPAGTPPPMGIWEPGFERKRDEAPDPLIDTKLDNFHVKSLLGKGGFGKVFLAQDTVLAREVAIKLLHQSPEGTDPRRQELFEREAKALAALSEHESIVRIYQWGEHAGQNYFALEFVESSAEKLIEEYPDGLPLAMALRIALECAAALEAAHEQGILHRDIKPPNILINPKSGRAKVADFGLARLRTSGEFSFEGSISGSPPYMSPEQARGVALDERSDIYSLGMTLYELLCGKQSVEGDSASEIMEHIVKDERFPLSERRPDLPKGVCAIVDRATAHACADRYQSASEFGRELRIALNALERSGAIPEAVPVTPYPRLKSAGIAVAALMVLAVAAVLGRVWLTPAAPGSVGGNTALANADAAMAAGEFLRARDVYRVYLDRNPNDNTALLGHGLALALLNDLVGAEEAFEKIGDDAMRREGGVALAFERRGAGARETIEAAAAGGTGYAELLLAKVDALDGRHGAAANRLAGLAPDNFRYGWQFRNAQRALGQAYYRGGQFKDARRVFHRVRDRSDSGPDMMARAYLSAIARKADAALRQEANDRARKIREMIDSGAVATSEFDAWTSRPLTCYILPADAGTSRYAVESGLADLLPAVLADMLDEDTAINVLERGLIEEIVEEQVLSAYLSKESGQLMLGKVLGARLLIHCRFASLGGSEKVFVKMTDIETTDKVRVDSADIPRRADPEELIRLLSENIGAAAERAFPLQARLYGAQAGPEINIGSAVGLRPGMVFDILYDAGAEAIPEASAVVADGVRGGMAPVLLNGINQDELPTQVNEGLYVRIREERESTE